MAEDAGVCVGVKGMLAARKDKKKKEKEPYQWCLSPKCVHSLEKGFPQSSGVMFSLQCETLRFLKLCFRGAGIGLVRQARI